MDYKEELELLLNNFIVTKESNREWYYKIKAKIKKLREFTTSKLGCDIIINSLMIKLEKIPSVIDNTFKIEDFNHQKDYILLVLVIMFLEDKAKDEQFILSNLTTFITNTKATVSSAKVSIDFKDYSTRKSLVDVLKYMIKIGVIKLIDGNDNLFKDSIDNEVLYQNTGISHYMIRQFKEDIFALTKPEDFLQIDLTKDPLSRKRYFTYRSLLFYPNFDYNDADIETYHYLINYRNRIISDVSDLLDGELLIYNNVALLTTTEKNGRITFPNSRKVIHDIVLLVNDYISNEVDTLHLTKFEFEQVIIKMHKEKSKYFSKEFREMKMSSFVDIVIDVMEKFKLLKVEDTMVIFSPVTYLISGNYPKEEEESQSTFEQFSMEMEG